MQWCDLLEESIRGRSYCSAEDWGGWWGWRVLMFCAIARFLGETNQWLRSLRSLYRKVMVRFPCQMLRVTAHVSSVWYRNWHWTWPWLSLYLMWNWCLTNSIVPESILPINIYIYCLVPDKDHNTLLHWFCLCVVVGGWGGMGDTHIHRHSYIRIIYHTNTHTHKHTHTQTL